MGSRAQTKIVLDIFSEESLYTGNMEIVYAPDQLVMDNLVLVETVRLLTGEIEQEEEAMQKVGDTLVELLRPKALYAIMRLRYEELQYTVEVDYEFNKTGKYELRRE